MKLTIRAPIRAFALMLACVAIAAGCSSSGSGESTLPSVTESDSAGLDDPVVPDPVVPDPVVPNTTRVDFDITVPAYVSNALQVTLEWGDQVFNASWVGDEIWAASGEFPTESEQLLTVTFYDDNGARVLGTVETTLRTGSNAMETLTISADQFDTARWDDDDDGLSNLDELIAGTDPSIDETDGLEVRAMYPRHDDLEELMLVSAAYEADLPAARPHFEDATEAETCSRDPSLFQSQRIRTIDLDATGTGSYLQSYMRNCRDRHTESSSATRTNTGGSIQWAGTEFFQDSDAGMRLQLDFTTETTALGNGRWRQVGAIDRIKYGFGGVDSGVARFSYTFSGQAIDGSNDCEIAEGTLRLEGRHRTVEVLAVRGFAYSSYTGPEATSTVYTKGADDDNWRVISENDGQLVEEYRVESIDVTFYCGFADLPNP